MRDSKSGQEWCSKSKNLTMYIDKRSIFTPTISFFDPFCILLKQRLARNMAVIPFAIAARENAAHPARQTIN